MKQKMPKATKEIDLKISWKQKMQSILSRLNEGCCRFPFYHWMMGRGNIPAQFLFYPNDGRQGDAGRGRWLCNNAFDMDGEQLTWVKGEWLHDVNKAPLSHGWCDHIHGFAWLRDLKALGGETARQQARLMIEDWMQVNNHWDPLVWHAGSAGKRIFNWITQYNFYGASASDEFRDNLIASIMRQARHISRSLNGSLWGMDALYAAAGLITTGAVFEGCEQWVDQGARFFTKQADQFILEDGLPKSRNIQHLYRALRLMNDCRLILLQSSYPAPMAWDPIFERGLNALRALLLPDDKLPTLNGTQEGTAESFRRFNAQFSHRSKPIFSFPNGGMEKVHQGKTILWVNRGDVAPWPQDIHAHAAPLAFEMMYNKDRLFVSSGTHPVSTEWAEETRQSKSHNMVTLNDQNAYDIRPDGHISRRPSKLWLRRTESDDGVLIHGHHSAYEPVNGYSLDRFLFVNQEGEDIRGEERFSHVTDTPQPQMIVATFHLHPRALVSLVKDDSEAIIKLPSGSGWRFYKSAGKLSIEDSLYIGQGCHIRKTKKLVIRAKLETKEASLKWALKKE